LLCALLMAAPRVPAESADAPPGLREPDYFIENRDGKWRVRKPRVLMAAPAQAASPEPWIIYEDSARAAAEERASALPRVRLARVLVDFNPRSRERMPIANWTREADAQEIESDIRALLTKFASERVHDAFAATPLYMARLNGASGHIAEESNDYRSFVVYLDPFRATGRLHAAATLTHEFAHLGRYRERGFHANRAASVMPRKDFILLGVEDELRAYRDEAGFVAAFLNSLKDEVSRRAARKVMASPDLRWPAALRALLDSELSATPEVRKQIVLDLERQASRYWVLRRRDRLDESLEAAIRNWYPRSAEWQNIAQTRAEWLAAGADVSTSR
jgi:hypothetical protein